jgi:hypothetical protein
LANLGEPWRTLANLGERWKPDSEPELEAWRAVLCCAVLASGVSQLAKAVFLIFLQRQCNL